VDYKQGVVFMKRFLLVVGLMTVAMVISTGAFAQETAGFFIPLGSIPRPLGRLKT
jgi:hypothetical protein